MFDAFEKFFYASVGIYTLTKKRAEEVVCSLVETGKVRAEEGVHVVDELMQRADKEREALVKLINSEVAKALKKMGLVSMEEYRGLLMRVEKLEAYINELSLNVEMKKEPTVRKKK